MLVGRLLKYLCQPLIGYIRLTPSVRLQHKISLEIWSVVKVFYNIPLKQSLRLLYATVRRMMVTTNTTKMVRTRAIMATIDKVSAIHIR